MLMSRKLAPRADGNAAQKDKHQQWLQILQKIADVKKKQSEFKQELEQLQKNEQQFKEIAANSKQPITQDQRDSAQALLGLYKQLVTPSKNKDMTIDEVKQKLDGLEKELRQLESERNLLSRDLTQVFLDKQHQESPSPKRVRM